MDRGGKLVYNRGMEKQDSFTTQYLTFEETRTPNKDWWDMTINPFIEGTKYHGWFEEKDCKRCRSNLINGMGPSHKGSSFCRMNTSLASGGNRSHCTCRACF